MASEKRREVRHLVCVLAHLEKNSRDKKRSALVSDLSAVGAQVLTREVLAPGDAVHLELHLEDDAVVEVHGKVVRILPRPADRASLWTLNAGVEFDAPRPELGELAARLAGR